MTEFLWSCPSETFFPCFTVLGDGLGDMLIDFSALPALPSGPFFWVSDTLISFLAFFEGEGTSDRSRPAQKKRLKQWLLLFLEGTAQIIWWQSLDWWSPLQNAITLSVDRHKATFNIHCKISPTKIFGFMMFSVKLDEQSQLMMRDIKWVCRTTLSLHLLAALLLGSAL